MGDGSLRDIQEDLSRVVVAALIDTARNFSIACHLPHNAAQADILGDTGGMGPPEMDIPRIACILDGAL